MNEKKYPTPDNHFFEISKDQHSRERVKILREVRREIDGMYPDLQVAFSLWGSLSKGKELKYHGDSDTDLTVFYNEEALKRIANTSDTFFGVSKSHLVNHRPYEDVFTDMLGDFIRKRIQKGHWGSSATSGIVLYSVDDGLFADLAGSDSRGNSFAITFFGYDLGGLRFYQKQILRKVTELPDNEREEWWTKIKDSGINFFRRRKEEDLREKLKADIPQTFGDACKRYGVKI